MRRRPAPPPSAQQMIREYLGRVSVAATKVLPKGDRLLFVGRTRAAIEAKVGPLASADADHVLSALNSLGEPEELAKRERERLYSARRRGAAAAPPALWKPSKESRRGVVPPPARRPDPAQKRRTRPWPHRGLTGPDEPQPAQSPPPSSESGPAPAIPRQVGSPEPTSPPAEEPREQTSPQVPLEQALEEGWPTEPARAGPAAAEPVAAEPVAAEPVAAEPEAGEPAEPVPPVDAGPVGLPVPDPAGLEPDVPDQPTPEPQAPGPGGPVPFRPEQNGTRPAPEQNGSRPLTEQDGTPPGWLRPAQVEAVSNETKPISIVPGMSQSEEAGDPPPASRRSAAVAPLAEVWSLARKHPLEAVAVVLLGLGGLILPFPFWLIGGLVALRSRRWDARDKWVALAGPLLFTFVVLLIRAGTSSGNPFPALYHAFGHDFWTSIRAGCVLCAAYLVWRLRRGPRLRTIAPWQRPR